MILYFRFKYKNNYVLRIYIYSNHLVETIIYFFNYVSESHGTNHESGSEVVNDRKKETNYNFQNSISINI